jgi:hypothetical protein
MAKLGEVLAANRYEALVVGPRLAVTYETQAGQPVDGSSKLARELSPFQIRLLPPDALLAAADAPSGSIVDGTNTDVGLISASLVGSDKSADANELANTLSRAHEDPELRHPHAVRVHLRVVGGGAAHDVDQRVHGGVHRGGC